MSIPVSCSCGQQFMAQPHLAGKQVACPNCGQPLAIPAAAGAAAAPAAAAGSGSVVTCVCGKSFKAPPHLAGQRVACPDCGQPIDVPASAAPSSPVSAGASPRPKAKKAAFSTPPAVAAEPAVGGSLGWDDALAAPDLGAGAGLAAGPAAMQRRVEHDTIEPMTMYAIWIGGGVVVLLILLILGHFIWKAFADDEPGGAAPGATPPAQEAPREPGAAPSGKPPAAAGTAAPAAES